MLKEDLDISNNVRNQINKKLIKIYDKIIILMKEKKNIPNYLKDYNKAIIWDIEDPKGKSNLKYVEVIKK